MKQKPRSGIPVACPRGRSRRLRGRCVLARLPGRVGMRGLFAVAAIAALVSVAAPAFGQGGTASTISGAVVDSGGGVVPGADVVVRHNATGITTSVVTNGQGAFTIPGLAVGTYTVTVSL